MTGCWDRRKEEEKKDGHRCPRKKGYEEKTERNKRKRKTAEKIIKEKSRASVPCAAIGLFLISALLIPFADVEKGLSFLLSFPYLRKQKKKYDFCLFWLDLRKMHAIMKTSIKRTPLLGLFGCNVLVRFCCTNPLLGRSPFGEAIFVFFSLFLFMLSYLYFSCPSLLSPDVVCLMEISSFFLKDGISFFMMQSLLKKYSFIFFSLRRLLLREAFFVSLS